MRCARGGRRPGGTRGGRRPGRTGHDDDVAGLVDLGLQRCVFAQAPQAGAPPAAPSQAIGDQAPANFARPNPDASGPAGTWYLDLNNARVTAVIAAGADGHFFTGTLTDGAGAATPLDDIGWDPRARRIEFRAHQASGNSGGAK